MTSIEQEHLDRTGPAAASVAAPPAAADVAKLKTLAAQFESMLLGQMLKEMRNSVFDADEDTGFGNNPLSESMFSELSLALSRAGGVGLADSLLGPMGRQVDLQAAPGGLPSVELPLGGRLGSTLDVTSVLASTADSDDESDAGRGDLSAVGGRLSSSYGWRKDPLNGALKFHKGADIAMPAGQDIPSAKAGKVTFAGEMPGYGLTVVVDHGNHVTTRYAHLSTLGVAAGDTVAAGQVVGKSGATGRVTGPHLHFEVLEDGQPVDPGAWLGSAGRL